VVNQLRRKTSEGSTLWMGLASPPLYLDGGMGMSAQLLTTRLDTLREQVGEEEQSIASREKLEAERCHTVGEIKAVEMLLEILAEGAASCREVARRREGELTSRVSECDLMQAKYERQRGELEVADQGFEQAHGALAHIDAALAVLQGEQSALLEATRLQAYARARHAEPAHHAVMEHRRWLRELEAFESAAAELSERAAKARDTEVQEVILGLHVAGLDASLKERVEGLMTGHEISKAIQHDLSVWGCVLAHEDDLTVSPSATPVQTSKDAAIAARGPKAASSRAAEGARASFEVMVTVSKATRELLLRLHDPKAVEALNPHMHRTRELLSGGSLMVARLVGDPVGAIVLGKLHVSSAPSSTDLAKKAREAQRQLQKQLDKRIVYDFAGREVVSASGLKQSGVGVCMWEWCVGALQVMRLLSPPSPTFSHHLLPPSLTSFSHLLSPSLTSRAAGDARAPDAAAHRQHARLAEFPRQRAREAPAAALRALPAAP